MNPENKTATFKVKICQIAVSYRSNAPSQSMNDNNGFLKWKKLGSCLTWKKCLK